MDVVLLPETLIGRMNPTTRKRWKDFLNSLGDKTIFILGAEIPRGRKYDNVMVAFNDPEEQTAIQRCPVPFSMYRPFSQWGANAAILSCGENSMMFFSGQKNRILDLLQAVFDLALSDADSLQSKNACCTCKFLVV